MISDRNYFNIEAGDEKCTASGGTCQNRYSCNLGYSKIETGKCAGNRDRICCVPKCVEAGGECKHRSTCTLSANEIKTGKCPGDKDNICCVPKEPDSGRYINWILSELFRNVLLNLNKELVNT